MSLLTEQEIDVEANKTLIQLQGLTRHMWRSYGRAIESAVIQKIKAQGPAMRYHGICVVDCGEHGHADVELLKLIPAGTNLYRLPKGD